MEIKFIIIITVALFFIALVQLMKVYDLAAKTLDLAASGLRRRSIFDDSGNDETGFLQPLRAVISSKKTPAEIMLDHYYGDWAENIDQVFTSNRY